MAMGNSSSAAQKWFTNEFLEQILKRAENDDTIVVTRSNINSASEKGDNYASTVLRIKVSVKRLESIFEIKSIIVKLPSNTIFGKAVLHGFPREIKMFRDILPRLQRLLDSVMPDVQCEFGAKYYYSENEIPYVLMLEDLSVRGFKLADRSVGLDLDHCELVMKTLARFHASSIPVYKENPDLFDIYKRGFFFETKAMEKFFTSVSKNQIKTVIEVVEKWPKEGQGLAQKLKRRSEKLIEDFKKVYESDPKDYNVLTHGDLSINNIMFRYDNITGHVQETKFIDYQECTIASPVTDFYHFFYTSIRDDVREHHTEDLLQIYHVEFVKTLKVLKYKHKTISFETLLQEYERKSLLGFFYAVVFLPLMMTQRGVGYDLETMRKDAEDDSTKGSVSKESEPVLQRLLPLYEKKGLF